MNEEASSFPQLDFHLNSYQRDETGQVANIEEARTIIRSLHDIIRFLQVSPFELLPISAQAEIAFYLLGTQLLLENDGQQREAKNAALEALFNEQFASIIQQEKMTLNAEEILLSVEHLFKDFGK